MSNKRLCPKIIIYRIGSKIIEPTVVQGIINVKAWGLFNRNIGVKIDILLSE